MYACAQIYIESKEGRGTAMLSAADVPLGPFLAKFAQLNVPVAFLVPTQTGYGKSIMDATAPVRELLEDAKVHVYEEQLQGPANKKKVDSYFVHPDRMEKQRLHYIDP